MLFRKIFGVTLAFVVFGSSCASVPSVKINEETKEDKFAIKTTNSAYVGLLGRLKPGTTCASVDLKTLDVKVEHKGEGKELELAKDCVSFKDAIWIRTKNYAKEGEIEIQYSDSEWKKVSQTQPTARVRFENAEFSSDKNQVPTGAIPLAGDQTLSDSVDYNAGDYTDWFNVEPDSKKVSLTFEHLESKNQSIAHFYRRKKKSRRLNHVLRLRPGRSYTLNLSAENEYFVRVRSYAYENGSKYVLRKKNITETKKEENPVEVFVPVVDCFAVDSEFSTALIKNEADLKVGEVLEILAQTSGGKMVSLGNCHISSVFNDQASCRLNSVVNREFVHFKGKVL